MAPFSALRAKADRLKPAAYQQIGCGKSDLSIHFASNEMEHPSPAGNLGFPVRDASAVDGGAALWHKATVFTRRPDAIHSHGRG
jgi:hypothetical protein